MKSKFVRLPALLLVVCSFTTLAFTQRAPLTDRQLLGLVAGNALSDNVVHYIKVNGLCFAPTDLYRQQLSDAGADTMVLDALKAARTPTCEAKPATPALLEHLAAAGKFMRDKQERKSAGELAAAAKEDPLAAELGFVMGDLLRRENQFETAATVYQQVIEADSGFPEAHVKLAYCLYRLQDSDGAMREAKLELSRNPNNPEAHKVLGLGLSTKQAFDAAIAEYREALRLKPNYAMVHQNLGILYDQIRDVKNAISEYKQFVAASPDADAGTLYELGTLLMETSDVDGAIHALQQAKKADPSRVDVRQNLGAALLNRDKDAAVREFRELVTMEPEFPLGHIGLGLALIEKDDPKSSEPEFRKAIELDPTSADAVAGFGKALLAQMKYDDAMAAFAHAVQLDPNSWQGHLGKGRVYLYRKNYPKASEEFRAVTMIQPDSREGHDLLGKAMLESGDADGAIAEFKASMLVWSGNSGALLQLARAYEKKGDATQAIDYYRQASEAIPDAHVKADYEAALKRLAPNGAPAPPPAVAEDAFDKQLATATAGKSPEESWKAAFEIGTTAIVQHRYADAEKAYKLAMSVAEKFAPRDRRMWQTVDRLAMVYGLQEKYEECQSLMERGLALAQQIAGPKSAEVATQFEGLAQTASLRKNQVDARDFWMRALEIRQEMLGPRDPLVAVDLAQIANSYQVDQQYDKAEPLALKAFEIVQQPSGEWSPATENYAKHLVDIYLGGQKFDKAEAYCRRIVSSRERQFGTDSPMLVGSLQSLEDVLTKEGKTEEAGVVRKRRESIQPDQPGAK